MNAINDVRNRYYITVTRPLRSDTYVAGGKAAAAQLFTELEYAWLCQYQGGIQRVQLTNYRGNVLLDTGVEPRFLII